MKIIRRLSAIMLIMLGLVGLGHSAGKHAALLDIDGGIGPATADYIVRGIHQAEQQAAALVIIRMDTPGGVDKAMRIINKAILASSVPVVSYVSPSGARAASAGTYILYASHIAAMAPGTNLGAASPIDMSGSGGVSEKSKDGKTPAPKSNTGMIKATKDAAAYLQSLAELRGRNAIWARQAVLEAATLTASEAQKQGVIDLVADSVNDLLQKIDGRVIKLTQSSVTLATKELKVVPIEQDWRSKFLGVITDPSVAYILLLIGAYGIFFEFANPGFVLPGVVGAIALLLAMYAMHLLPINYAGLGLIMLGVAFMIGEAFVPSFGALGIGGVVAFVVGSVLLYDSTLTGFGVAWPVIFAMAAFNVLIFIFVIGVAVQARRRQVINGKDFLINQEGVALTNIDGRGQARINGEIWTIEYQGHLAAGDKVRVIAVNGLVLQVTKI